MDEIRWAEPTNRPVIKLVIPMKSKVNHELLGEFSGAIRPWLSTELMIELWSNVNDKAEIQNRVRNSRRRVHRSSIHYIANQRPGGIMSQSQTRLKDHPYPIMAKESLKPKTKFGIALNPTSKVVSHYPNTIDERHT